MADGFSVDLGALEDAATGVDYVLRDLDPGRADSLSGDAAGYGHDHLAGTVKDFCDRWEIGVEHLAADGRGISERLTRSVQDYLAVDKSAEGRMDGVLARAAGPDPAAH